MTNDRFSGIGGESTHYFRCVPGSCKERALHYMRMLPGVCEAAVVTEGEEDEEDMEGEDKDAVLCARFSRSFSMYTDCFDGPDWRVFKL